MKKTAIVFGLVAVMVLGVAYAFAQGPGFGQGRGDRPCWESGGPGYGPGPGRGPGWGRWGSLTSEQRAKFQELRRKFIKDTAELRGGIVAKRTELNVLWSDPNADPQAILQKERELRAIQNQMRDKAVEMRLEGRKILTPEQLAEMGPGWGMGRGMGPGMGHGFGRGWGGKGHGPGWGCGQGPCVQ